MRAPGLAVLVLLLPSLARADPPRAGDLCVPALAAAEQDGRLPARLLRSVAQVESGRVDPASGRLLPWPWTINVAGTGYYFDSKEEAVAAVRALQAAGVRSIDVGCAQVNLLHHPDAFASLDSAFDPRDNATYAARFLGSLHRDRGSWPLAVAAYHSSTPALGRGYALRVKAAWPDADRHGPWPSPDDAAVARPVIDYSIYTPGFALLLRRMDADRARLARGGTRDVLWVSRPAGPVPEPGSRRSARQGAGPAPR